MPPRKADKTAKPKVRKAAKRTAAQGTSAPSLPKTMVTGKASPAKAADGDKPVFAYIASLPEPQRSIAERVDALAARTLPDLQRGVKWGMSYYGVGDGRCFCCGGFAKHVGYAGPGTRVRGRHRRTPDRRMDETSRGCARCGGQEAIAPAITLASR
jgi:hypothetical protein